MIVAVRFIAQDNLDNIERPSYECDHYSETKTVGKVAVRFIAHLTNGQMDPTAANKLEETSMKWRKSPRLKEYDYKTNGYYFVTICTALRKPWLERYREEAEKILKNLPLRFEGVHLDYYCFMCDHVHVIFILNDASVSVGEIVRTYKALVTKTTRCKPFWEWNYYEHVIRNERALYEIRKYIQENPEKEKIDFKTIYSCINTTVPEEQDSSGSIYRT